MEYVLLGLGLLIVVLLVVVLCQLAAVRRRQSEDAGVKALETRLDRQQSELTAESLPPAIDALWADRELLRQRLAALPDADGTQLVLDQIHKYMKK